LRNPAERVTVFPVLQVPGFEHVTDQPEKPLIVDRLRQDLQQDLVIQRSEGLLALLPASMTSRLRCARGRKAFSARRQRLSC